MDFNTFLTTIYCLIDDWLHGQRLRQRGPQPTLHDSEVLTIELAGEFLGIDTEQGLYTYFRRHYGAWFPRLKEVDRTTFTRQAANLWVAKARLWRYVLTQLQFDPQVSLLDSFPVPVCRFARAYRCQSLAGTAAYGRDEVAKQTYYGLRAHLRVAWPGVIVDYVLSAANGHDLAAVVELLEGVTGWALGDRNYWSPKVTAQVRTQGVHLLAPFKMSKRERTPWPRWLVHTRRRIETVIGQLSERYHAKKVWARDAWHLCSRWLRKIASHSLVALLCQQAGISQLSFAELITD
jgi:Transposase DDE domain